MKCGGRGYLVSNPRKYVFFDRDGTIIEKIHHLRYISEVRLVDKLTETLKTFMELGFSFALVTNQSVIGRRISTSEEVEEINEFILKSLVSNGIHFDYILVCPHLPTDNCSCRKPKTGLIDSLIGKDDIDFMKSFMVGDQESDVLFGKALGMKTILISSRQCLSSADFVVKNFFDIVKIVEKEQLSGKLP